MAEFKGGAVNPCSGCPCGPVSSGAPQKPSETKQFLDFVQQELEGGLLKFWEQIPEYAQANRLFWEEQRRFDGEHPFKNARDRAEQNAAFAEQNKKTQALLDSPEFQEKVAQLVEAEYPGAHERVSKAIRNREELARKTKEPFSPEIENAIAKLPPETQEKTREAMRRAEMRGQTVGPPVWNEEYGYVILTDGEIIYGKEAQRRADRANERLARGGEMTASEIGQGFSGGETPEELEEMRQQRREAYDRYEESQMTPEELNNHREAQKYEAAVYLAWQEKWGGPMFEKRIRAMVDRGEAIKGLREKRIKVLMDNPQFRKQLDEYMNPCKRNGTCNQNEEAESSAEDERGSLLRSIEGNIFGPH